jgi:hypothetical protein
VPLPSWGAYNLAKAAIRAAAVQLRRELRAKHVAVTYVDPGVVASEFHSSIGIERTAPPVSSERAASAILRGIARRSAVVNVVPWQTAFSALGEWSGSLADPLIIRRFRAKRTSPEPATRHPEPATRCPEPATCHPEPVEGEQTSFERALEPVARRMERVKLPPAFLRDALVPGATLELGALAMRWAGMPNKNERAALREALDALAVAGYLEQEESETWRVVRAAE